MIKKALGVVVVSLFGWGAVIGLCSTGPFAATGNALRQAVPFPDYCITAGCASPQCSMYCIMIGCADGCFNRAAILLGAVSPPVPAIWQRTVEQLGG